MQSSDLASLCCCLGSIRCRIRPCEWRGHLDVTTIMAASMLGIAASAKRCQLPLHPPFSGHPVLGEAIVTEAPGDLPTVNAWPDECSCILTVGHDFQTDCARIFSSDGSHVVVGALGVKVECDYLSRSLLRCCLTGAGAPLAVSFAPLLANGRRQPDLNWHARLLLESTHVWALPLPLRPIHSNDDASPSQPSSLGHAPCAKAGRI